MQQRDCRRGAPALLLRRGRWKIYACAVLVGVPTWFGAMVSMLIPELSRALAVSSPLSAADGILAGYVGVAIGSVTACLLSERLARRKKVILVFMLILMGGCLAVLLGRGMPPWLVCLLLGVAGFGSGYNAMYVTTAAEMSGTNLRTTMATTVSNLVRASLIVMTLALRALTPRLGLVGAALAIQAVVGVLGILALVPLEETYGKDLDYIET
jgi:MFS family permease